MLEKLKWNLSPARSLTTYVFLAIPPIIWSIYLLAYWPAIMTFDSIDQWDQAMRFTFNDWHPVVSTLVIWLTTRIWASPASVAIFQILFFSTVVAFTLQSFQALGVPKWLLIVECLLFALFLPNGMMAITIWKDIPYSICVLGLTTILFWMIVTQGKWISRRSHIILLGLFSLGTSLFRHNGIPVSLATLGLLILFFRPYWRPLVSASIIFLGSYFLIKGPVYTWLHVEPDSSQTLGVTLLHPIAAHLRAGDTVTPDEFIYLNQILPFSAGWDYICYDASVLFYKGVDFAPVQQDPQRALNLFIRLTIANPKVTLKHYFCLSSFVWSLSQPNGVHLETVYQDNFLPANYYPVWDAYKNVVQQQSILPEIKSLFNKGLQWMTSDSRILIWRPALYLYLLILAVVALSVVSHNAHFLLLLAPSIVQSIIIMLTAQVQAWRYQYPVCVIAMLFVTPLLWSALNNKRTMRERIYP